MWSKAAYSRLAPNIDGIHQLLWNKHTLYHYRTKCVVQVSRLTHSRWSYDIHGFRHCIRIHRAVLVSARSSAHTERERPWCCSKGACLVRTKAILACQYHRKTPTRSGCSAQARCWYTEGDETRDSISADRNRAHSIAMRVDVALPEPLHLQEPAPCRTWLQWCSCAAGKRLPSSVVDRTRVMDVHIRQLRA